MLVGIMLEGIGCLVWSSVLHFVLSNKFSVQFPDLVKAMKCVGLALPFLYY